MMSTFKPIKTEKFANGVVGQIKESIFDGTYLSGDKLPSESDMAGLFGVSKVTVRQAIRVLENSGLIFTKQGVDGGIFVAEADSISVSSFLSDMLKLKRVTQSDLTMARLIFEPDIASLVADVWKENDLEEPKKNIRQAKLFLEKGDQDNTRLLSLEFHRLICNLTRNPVIIFTLNSVLDVLKENILRFRLDTEFIRNEINDHEIILEKIRRRRKDEAYNEMHKHIGIVHKKLEEMHKGIHRAEPKEILGDQL